MRFPSRRRLKLWPEFVAGRYWLVTNAIEGHTDAQGGGKTNQKLSEKRAAAVREYLLATTDLGTIGITATGYGESRPVANNETTVGRAKNRRIDVVIEPQFDAKTQR